MEPSDTSDRQDLADRLHSAAIHLLRSLRAHDAGSGVSPARLSALSVIVYSEQITMSGLAAAEQVRLPTMSRLIAGMEHDGLVQRLSQSADARVVTVTPTAKGREALRRGRRLRLTDLESRLETCSTQELADIQRATTVLERLFGHHATRIED